MEKDEFELPISDPTERRLGQEALRNARQLLGETRGVKPADVTDEDIAEAFRNGGFSEWEPELAGRVARAMANIAGFEHV